MRAGFGNNQAGVLEGPSGSINTACGGCGGAAGLLEGAGIVEGVAGAGVEIDITVVLKVPGSGVVDRGAVLNQQVAGIGCSPSIRAGGVEGPTVQV